MPEQNLAALGKKPPFRFSIRYKLAFPILLFVCLMLFLLFYTTFDLVRGLLREKIEERLKAITEVYAETLKVPMALGKKKDLQALMEWMTNRRDVLEVRVLNPQGRMIASVYPDARLPESLRDINFFGVKRVSADTYAAVSPIQSKEKSYGRVIVIFSRLDVDEELKQIFERRFLIAFIMVGLLALLVTAVTWLAIHPIFQLEKVAKNILEGDLQARADIHSFDEIEDVANAFNEMLSRLSGSLDRLRLRTEALEESEEKYRLVVENADDVIFTIAPEGEILLVNRGFGGCSREELIREGLPAILELYTEESRQKFQEALEQAVRDRKMVSNIPLTQRIKGANAESFYLLTLTPALDHEGNLKLIQGIMRDVTALKQIEIMKESLIRDVAHELKTPAAKFEMTLNWFEKELQGKNQKEQYGELIKIMRNNVDRLMSTINSILDLSRLESGMSEIKKEAIDLHQLLKQVAADLEPIVRAKKLDFETRFSAGHYPLKGDANMLYRVFVNLIQNACKFTDVGKITMKAEKKDQTVRIQVIDTGIGIEQVDLESIFDRFVQKTAASSGIGVGLTIAKDIVLMHHGKIWAESPGLGKGTTFTVEFPLA